jgi:hypothetical protein
MDEVRSGLRLAGALILGICWLCLAAAGIGIAFSETRYPEFVGWMALGAAAVLALVAMDKWVRVLPAILGLSILNALLTVWRGYVGADPSHHFPRGRAALMLATLILSSVLAGTIATRKLNRVDRVALLAFLVSEGWAIARAPSLAGFVCMPCCLVTAWGYERVRRHRYP